MSGRVYSGGATRTVGFVRHSGERAAIGVVRRMPAAPPRQFDYFTSIQPYMPAWKWGRKAQTTRYFPAAGNV
jgi:hypothetical protein